MQFVILDDVGDGMSEVWADMMDIKLSFDEHLSHWLWSRPQAFDGPVLDVLDTPAKVTLLFTSMINIEKAK